MFFSNLCNKIQICYQCCPLMDILTMNETTKRYWPLLLALGCLWGIVSVIFFVSLRWNQGHLVYCLDDAYIHMAIAKNFAVHGVWGVTQHAFTSSSSSLLWTLLLSAIYYLCGVNEAAPLLLNVFAGSVLLWLVYRILNAYRVRAFTVAIALLAVLFVSPLPFLIFSGMEHLIHALFCCAFLYVSGRVVASPPAKSTSAEQTWMLVLAPLMIMSRFEGMFLVFVVCVLLLVIRRWFFSCCLGAVALSPVIVYGLVSVSKGWYFLPNSVLLKGKTPELSGLADLVSFIYDKGYLHLIKTPHILFLFLAVLVIFVLRSGKREVSWLRDERQVMLLVLMSTILLHMQFAVALQYRYEAYLIVLGVLVIASALKDVMPGPLNCYPGGRLATWAAVVLMLVFFMMPFCVRAGRALYKTPLAMRNIYEQQYQMGLFFKNFYEGEAVAANDIGAINFLGNIRCLDLWGLSNMDVARARRQGRYNSRIIYELASKWNVKAVVVYDDWFKKVEKYGLPEQWTRVGEWEIPNNVIAGDPRVTFYAEGRAAENKLVANLKEFALRMPEDVRRTGKITE